MEGSLGIRVQGEQVQVSFKEDVNEENIIEMLTFTPESAEQLLTEHAGRQVYWEGLAIRMKTRLVRFQAVWAKKWWAYNRVYGEYVLEAYGQKQPTKNAAFDKCILIYSKDATENERQKYSGAAFEAASKKDFKGSQMEFHASMYKYLKMSPPWYYETLMETEMQLQEEFDIIRSVAERFHSQGFHLDLYGKMQMAKRFNVEGKGISEKELMRQIGGKR